MKKFALINGNQVINVVVAETKPSDSDMGRFVEYTDQNPAIIGGEYLEEIEVFVDPQPYDSWTLNSEYRWEAPEAKPDNGYYRWEESQLSWIEMVN
jgi:hypothetical protein